MNTIDVLQYGHQTVVEAVDGLPERKWHTGIVCGTWTVKDTIAHLASFEHLLIDVFRSLIAETATPTLNSFRAGSAVFNNAQVASRRHLPVTEVWSEYTATYRQTISLITQIPIARRRLNGLIAWYGLEYDLEDFIVYNFYGHKREHSSQIAVFRERLASTE
jgi:hypothetical protein